MAALGGANREIRLGLDPFGDGRDVAQMRQGDNRRQDPPQTDEMSFGARACESGNEQFIHFENVDRQFREPQERGIADPEVIECHTHPRFAQRRHSRQDIPASVQRGLDDLDIDLPFRNREKFGREPGFGEVLGVDVDRHRHDCEPGPAPARDVLAGAQDGPLAHPAGEAHIVQGGQELRCRYQPVARVPPADQRFGAAHLAGPHAELRLVVGHELVALERTDHLADADARGVESGLGRCLVLLSHALPPRQKSSPGRLLPARCMPIGKQAGDKNRREGNPPRR